MRDTISIVSYSIIYSIADTITEVLVIIQEFLYSNYCRLR